MTGIVRLAAAATVGGALALAIPQAGLLAATQEIIGFLSFLMAGLLPAMILTATILRGDGISVKAVDDYGQALGAQLRFWAFLFWLAGVAVAAIVCAKVFSAPGAEVSIHWRRVQIESPQIIGFFLVVAGAAVGGVMQRLYPAYVGLRSLLHFNVLMARGQAEERAKAAARAVEAEVLNAPDKSPYRMMREAS